MKLYYVETRNDTIHYVLADTKEEAKEKYIKWAESNKGWSTDIRNCYQLKNLIK